MNKKITFIGLCVALLVSLIAFVSITKDVRTSQQYVSNTEVVDEVVTRLKSFIELDASFNTADSIERIDESRKYMTEEGFDDFYLNNGRFMSLPDVADKPVINFLDSAVEFTDYGYKTLIMWSESYDNRVYYYTGIIEMNSEYLINTFRKVPHLK